MTSSKKRSTKPRNFKAEYARRVANAPKGSPQRQLARGHKPGEARVRRERERKELGGLTGDQIRSIRRWYYDFSHYVIGGKFKTEDMRVLPSEERIIEWAQENGYDKFGGYRKIWRAARTTYIREVRNGKWESRGAGYLSLLAEMIPASVDSIEWLYYH